MGGPLRRVREEYVSTSEKEQTNRSYKRKSYSDVGEVDALQVRFTVFSLAVFIQNCVVP
jgi:hypothetical protein